ncbi:uncharacterized protein LOC126884772 isoform X2 [Diabrotica virgifera virgifera]|nr:uncharacterized protein LOC126884772 isoform X2 [Diabrotica virgifera virgifera]
MSCCDDSKAGAAPAAASASASGSASMPPVSAALGVPGECGDAPDPIVAAAMLEATQLTDSEREIILGVLGRDELLRREQQMRVLHLKAELQHIRRKGALKPSGAALDTTGPDQDPDRYCRRCRVELGRVINRGAYCRACRLKVCKACREYSFRTTDWVCTVCKKQMEIQAASGEWMNEFVRRPSKRRETRVCLPTADIIKRTIRRSWTISNPTPRWSAIRGSPELRPYNSLPRKQDINNYPSLALHQANLKNQEISNESTSPTYRRRSPRRTQSEDIYDDQGSSGQFRGGSPIGLRGNSPDMDVFVSRPSRMNPLMKLGDGRTEIDRRRSPMRKSNEGSSEDGSSKEDGSPKSRGILTPESIRKFDRNPIEKRVSFESHISNTRMLAKPAPVFRTQSLVEGRVQNHLMSRYPIHHEDNSDNSEDATTHSEANDGRDENNPIELCEIEPFSGTVFRKMMVRRRRNNLSASASNCATSSSENAPVDLCRKLPVVVLTFTVAGVTITILKPKTSNQSSDTVTGRTPGWRRGPDSDVWDILLPEGDDYKLVFINSDSSSKEETSSREEDDNDSSSTASSFPIDECDWDYFEPGSRPAPVINWSSPFGSPRVYRRDVAESPLGSPLVYRRRMRESDTGTDEDNVRQDSGSPASSDGIFQPRIHPDEPPFDAATQTRTEKVVEDSAALQCVHTEDIAAKPCCHACGAPTQYIPIPVPVPIPFPVPAMWPPHEPPLMLFGEQRFRVLPRNLWPYLSQAALIWPTLGANGGTAGTTMPATTDRDACALPTHEEPDNVSPSPALQAEEQISGYLECENRYDSSSDSSDSSDSSKPRVRRVYNVSGTDRHSDDALPSSNVSSDGEEEDGRMSQSSVREDDMTSSGSADTDSDDTGTVADQKSKRFSRIFVVNKVISSSSNSCSSSSDTDTSDNDTDTELDCTVILTNVKQLDEENDNQICDNKSSDKISEKIKEREYGSSSPGLSDVSAESVHSSDVDQTKDDNDTKDDISEKAEEIEEKIESPQVIPKNSKEEKDTETETNDINTQENALEVDSQKKDEGKKGKKKWNLIRVTMQFIKSEKKFSLVEKRVDDLSKESVSLKQLTMNDNRIEENGESLDKKGNPVVCDDNQEVSNNTKLVEPEVSSSKDLLNEEISLVTNEKLTKESAETVSNQLTNKPLETTSMAKFDNKHTSESDSKDKTSATRDSGKMIPYKKSSGSVKLSDVLLSGKAPSSPLGVISESVEAIPVVSAISCVDNEQPVDAVSSGETPAEAAGADDQQQRALGEWNEIRSGDAVNVEGNSVHDRNDGVHPGAIVCGEGLARHAARYTSLVMITQEPAPDYQQVSVVTSDTTTLVPGNDVVVRHTNWQEADHKRHQKICDNQNHEGESVTVITGGDTLSAFEEGLADDDSWVENLSHDEEDEDEFATNSGTDSSSGEEVTLTCSAAIDQEEDLRGYHRAAIDFTLHTIVEESCEESEVEQCISKRKERPTSATDLEKYFFFGLGDGLASSLPSNREDAFSETSSIYSEGMESLGGSEEVHTPNDTSDPAELASSRLEKYFLSGFMGFTAERRDSDGSVGSDSEGRPSPEQRRKRLVRARGTGRSHSSSLDNLDNAVSEQTVEAQLNSEDSSSSDSENYDENSFEKPDGQFDTVKRKKSKKPKSSNAEESKNLEITQEIEEKDSETDEDGHKTPQPEIPAAVTNLTTTKNQQSRDSGFVGSCDDLLREQRDNNTPDFTSGKNELKIELEDITEEKKSEDKAILLSTPPATSLTRKDSFNNWSSDEETNLMMCKMRQFFKTMVANSQLSSSSKPSTPTLSCTAKPLPSPRAKRCKPPQLVYFENELTRLMKTVPGIRDDQVREIVEYLSSEDTWSDSYDSSDYTSSDLEITTSKTVLQQQISDSCKQIINKFDNRVDDEGDEGDGGIIDESHGLNKETAFVYQKLVASIEKMASGDHSEATVPKVTPHSSPPLIAKVMHHIGSRLVALMHEVSSGESHASNSPKTKHYHRRLQHKISSASSTTTEDDCPEGSGDVMGYEDHHVPYNLLPRSRSHDLLMGETRAHQSTGGVSDIAEEKEASDCERFSWRGSFESALLATDSRNKLSLLGGEASASASALAIAAKRRSAGDLLFSHKSLSREQLDRVRSCGSIGGANSEDKLWVTSAIRPNRRRSSVPDATCGSGGSADGEDEDEEMESRSTLPRSLQGGTPTTNSLPRLPTTAAASSIQKSQSHHFLSQNVKSARYRPPGFNRLTAIPKRAVSAPGLQPSHQRRGRRSQQSNVINDEVGVSEAHSSPMLASPRNGTKSATPSPVTSVAKRNGARLNPDWHDEDLDRIGSLQNRGSLSTLGARSDSMASVYSGAGEGRYGTVAVRGQVEFGLQYNYKAGALEIQIKQCKDLAPVDTKRNRSDPYVKVYLLPDKSKSGKRKTKVKKHTLNPVFDECLKFHISLNGLESRTLWLTVWHSDMFGRNDFLGEVMMTLENKVFDDPTPKWYNLQERTEPFEDVSSYKGDIIVCLKFIPPDMTVQKKGKRSRGALHVLVKEAKSLTAVKANGTSDPFCKSYLLPDKGRSSKQKTPVAKRTTNPVWNYTFIYDDVTLQELAERCLELTVWDHDRLASNEFLGGVRFSLGTGKHYGKPVDWMDASGRELSLWKNMLEKPNFWVEGSLSLRSSLESRGS